MKVSEFSPWWVRNCRMRMYNRRRYYNQSKGKNLSHRSIPTWFQCYNNARSKLIYRYTTSVTGISPYDDWNTVIKYQTNKLFERHDPIYLWGISEYYNCEKVNNEGFPQELFPSLVWRFKAIEQAADMSKRLQCDIKHKRTERFTWWNVIGDVRRKCNALKHEDYFSEKDDEFWFYCFSTGGRDSVKHSPANRCRAADIRRLPAHRVGHTYQPLDQLGVALSRPAICRQGPTRPRLHDAHAPVESARR